MGEWPLYFIVHVWGEIVKIYFTFDRPQSHLTLQQLAPRTMGWAGAWPGCELALQGATLVSAPPLSQLWFAVLSEGSL